MSSLEESLAWTKAHYPNLKIIEVNQFSDLCTSTEEEKQRSLDKLISYLFEESLDKLLKEENKDWISIQSHVNSIVKCKYRNVITPKEQ